MRPVRDGIMNRALIHANKPYPPARPASIIAVDTSRPRADATAGAASGSGVGWRGSSVIGAP
jgi:hypothetical protein